jgi:hypothetical protein
VLDQNAHDKGCAVRILVIAVRRRRTAKRANPVVITPSIPKMKMSDDINPLILT